MLNKISTKSASGPMVSRPISVGVCTPALLVTQTRDGLVLV